MHLYLLSFNLGASVQYEKEDNEPSHTAVSITFDLNTPVLYKRKMAHIPKIVSSCLKDKELIRWLFCLVSLLFLMGKYMHYL